MLKYLFYLCVITLSLGQFSAVYKSGDSSIYIFDLCIGLLSILGVLYFLIKRHLFIPKPALVLFAFSFIALLSLVLHLELLRPFEFVISSFYLVRWVFYLISAVVLVNMIRTKLISIDEVFWAFIISGIFITFAGFIQLMVLPDFEVLDPSLGWDPHKNRLASTFFDPNFTGAYLVICTTLLFKYLKEKRRLVTVSLLILILGIFLTFSRSSWAMFAVVILVYGLFKYRWLLLVSVLLAFSAYFFVPRVQTRISGATDPADSAHFRLISWANTWTIAKDNLLTGVGFNAFRYAQRDYGFLDADTFNRHSGAGSDSSLLFVLAATGISGLVIFLSGFIGIFRTTGDTKTLLYAIFGGLFLHSLFVNSLFFPQIMFLWLIVLNELSYSLRK